MAGKNKSAASPFSIDAEQETIAYQKLVNELNEDVGEVWLDAIDSPIAEEQMINSSSSWMIEDNNDALSEYMDDVTDFIDPEDINSLDW